ncbi:ABC transporter ATP-binding protein [Halosquirtibacter xylanolyticus]|uniref:ABC transporter ATP-binding protein n=1 Tax=Halosquirtibacter xylanolyticus TaxID=3374599 RepID=UPI0037499B38|nr:ABC transporter ATP-binding protein [Prolixibacteraceae bacterium]
MKLKIKNASIGYIDNGKVNTVKNNINLQASNGDIIALLGGNGIGKSTLLRSIIGIQPLLDGDILYDNKNIKNYSKQSWSRKISYVSTEQVFVPNMTVYDIVSLGRFPYTGWLGRLKAEDTRMVKDAMNKVGVLQFREREVSTLSDGEKQRVMIARALAQDTEIVILDEPTAFLDLPNKYEIIYLLKHLARTMGKIIIFSTHDFNIASHEVDKLWLVTKELCVEGAPEDMMLNKTVESLFQSDKIEFDLKKGDFVSIHTPKLWVNLPQWLSNTSFMVIEKALSRIHVAITSEATLLSIDYDNGKWLLTDQDRDIVASYESIYLLCRALNEYLNLMQ